VDSNFVFLVISQFGLQNVCLDLDEAHDRAKVIHENAENMEIAFGPVWVKAHVIGVDDDASFDVGMFPDRRGTGSPGDWESSNDDDGNGREDFPHVSLVPRLWEDGEDATV
jgi:hypothetical protein